MRTILFFVSTVALLSLAGCTKTENSNTRRTFNDVYRGEYLTRVAFPIGGIGAGMVCLEGTGGLSHVSVFNKPDMFNEPCVFASITVKGLKNGAKVLEGPVPDYKIFGRPRTANGAPRTNYGLPRFENAEFEARFPFGRIHLKDRDLPVEVYITGWSPFIPLDQDNSSLPCGALEYRFVNNDKSEIEIMFSYNAVNFLTQPGCVNAVKPIPNGFILSNQGAEETAHLQADFAIFTSDDATLVDHCWFRGTWYDPLSVTWKHIEEGNPRIVDPVDANAPGASLFVPFTLKPGEEKTINLMMAWYVPNSIIREGVERQPSEKEDDPAAGCCESPYYRPWYSSKFKSINEVATYWLSNYNDLRDRTGLFTECFYNTTLPAEVVEAIAANLTTLKSPTVLRQYDGKLWGWEGCSDNVGCCAGTCTHVWNYAQAIPHLFPSLERSLRETEFFLSQDTTGFQIFRTPLPVKDRENVREMTFTSVGFTAYAAADGQLGGIMKAYREWRISGDDQWLRNIFPAVKRSLDFCIKEWDPRETGTLEEPHHNTYDVEFWGPDGMCTSFYLGALKALILMGEYLGEDVNYYRQLLEKGVNTIENELFDGEYFIQKIMVEGLNSPTPVEVAKKSIRVSYSPEAMTILEKEGPKYQYGKGCLSDGILGMWIAKVCGMDDPIITKEKVQSHIASVYKYNFMNDLSDHPNPQRPTYAMKNEGGLLLCSWPKGGKLTLPFVYCDEAGWTGIEYQVASHLAFFGMTKEALDIVKAIRSRYDGRVRNPFDEYDCGHWCARAMASYGMIQALTGIRYDAVTKTLYIDSKIGDDFSGFFSCQTGFGTVGLEKGKPFVKMASGSLDVKHCILSGVEYPFSDKNFKN